MIGPASRADEKPITVEKVWARATAAKAENGVVYLTIHNSGKEPDRLMSAETPVAAMAGVHESREEHGMMSMHETGPLPIAPGGTRALKPGGLHLMLMGLRHKLAKGATFPLTLNFEKAGTIDVDVIVETPGAMTYLPPAEAPARH